jgi:hypothetical protein
MGSPPLTQEACPRKTKDPKQRRRTRLCCFVVFFFSLFSFDEQRVCVWERSTFTPGRPARNSKTSLLSWAAGAEKTRPPRNPKRARLGDPHDTQNVSRTKPCLSLPGAEKNRPDTGSLPFTFYFFPLTPKPNPFLFLSFSFAPYLACLCAVSCLPLRFFLLGSAPFLAAKTTPQP